MGKLLRNDFNTLFKSKIILGGIGILFLFLFIDASGGYAWLVDEFMEIVKDNGVPAAIKSLMMLLSYRSLLIYFLMFLPSFVIGYDFDGGMIRNKIMAGFSRNQIYFSALITSYVTCLVYGLVVIVFSLIAYTSALTPVVLMNWMHDPEFVSILLGAVAFDLFIKFAICAVAVALMMMINQKTISIVAFFVLLLIGMLFGETNRAFARDENPINKYYDAHENKIVEVANPYYIDPEDPMKKVFISLDGINIFFSASAEYGLMTDGNTFLVDGAYYLGGLADIVIATGAGLYVFNKRNLK